VRYAIVSDVHANLASLEAVIAQFAIDDAVLCLGDIVGYGPEPNECIARIRDIAEATVLGNHDVAAVDDHGIALFNENARDAIRWTQGVITRENLAWLDGLSYEHRLPGFLLVHGAPVDYFRYVNDEEAARFAFGATDAPLIFIGHTHVAESFALAPDGSLAREPRREGGTLALEPGYRYIVNVGSVGQPRDRNPDASFVFFEPEAARVTWRRVGYEIALTQRKIGEACLPDALAKRLDAGR
jgi:diadenosine tetraphosphatase ApaH/serine/threonine PP2A family protein phosphatase